MKLNQKGFTMTELMMAVSTSVIISGIIFIAIRALSDQNDTTGLRMTIQGSAREALYRMLMEIRESSPTRINIAGSTVIEFQIPNATTPATAGYAVNWGDTIRYARGGTGNTQIIRTNTTDGSTTVLANDVTGISFTGNAASPSTVTVAISVQRSMANGRSIPATPITLTGHARIRNST